MAYQTLPAMPDTISNMTASLTVSAVIVVTAVVAFVFVQRWQKSRNKDQARTP